MRRTKLVLGVVAVMAAMLVVFAAPALAQDISSEFEQEAESGDVDQSFEVTSSGDNSNQTAGIQGVANTGNAQNQIGVTDAGGFDGGDFNNDDLDECRDEFGNDFCRFLFGNDVFFDDDDFFDNGFGGFGFDEVGSSITVSPTNVTSSDQQVNQAATAAG
jgi:hypothetical protein